MSFEALRWACNIRDKSVSAGARHLLLCLAQFADENETCFPSHEYLENVLNISSDTISRRIDQLTKHGLLHVVARKHSDGRRMNNYYVLLVNEKARRHAIAHGMEDVPPRSEDRTDESSHPANCGVDHPANDGEPPRKNTETTPHSCGVEYPMNTQITPTLSAPGAEREGAKRKPSDDDEDRLDRWETFRRIWPWDATEFPKKARAVFLRLSAADQQAAIDAVPKYIMACRERKTSVRNHGIAHAVTWLQGEGWLAAKGRSVESAASLAGRPFMVREGSPQAAAWARHEGVERLKFFQSKSGLICMRPTEWPPPLKTTASTKSGAVITGGEAD